MYYILKNIEGIWSVLPHFFQNHDISPQKSNLSTLYASYGVGGVGLYACIIGVYYYRLIKMILKRNDITVKMLAIGGLSGIVALLYGALFCVPFQSATIVFMCVFVMASIYVLLRIRMNESSKTGEEVFTDYTIKKLHKWQSYIAVSLGVLLTVLICTKVIKLTIAQHYFSKIMNRTEQVKIIKKGNDRTMISKLSPSCLEKDLQYAEKAIDYDQKNPLYHYTLGRLYDLSADISTTPSQQMIKNALEEYEKAVILSPGNTLFRNAVTIASKGIFLDNKNTTGRERENVSSKVSLIDKKTDNTDSARYIHEIILGALKYTDDYNELKVLVKNEEEGVYHLTIILFDNMKFEKNKNAFMQDMKLASKEERYQYVHALSDILVQKGAFADAVNLMEEYAENNPHNIEAVSWIVETVPNYPRNYNFEYVKNVFKRAHNANPENIYVLHKYVHYLYIKREYASVIKVLSDIAKKRDLHNNELYEIGKSYEQLGDKKEAITFYELILKSDPGNYEVKERVRKLSGSQK